MFIMSGEEHDNSHSNTENLVKNASSMTIKRIKNKTTKKESFSIVKDGRSVSSPHNRFVHGRRAILPAYCNTCYYRAQEEGGNGKCAFYKKDSVCVLRTDLNKMITQYDTRKAEDLRDIADYLIKIKMEDVSMATLLARMDGNMPDKSQRAEFNSLVQLMKLAKELSTVTMSASETQVSDGIDLKTIIRQITVKKVQDKESGK